MLQEASRVLKPGGLMVFSFLEFRIAIPEEIKWDSGQHMSGQGNLGQSVAVLRKNAPKL